MKILIKENIVEKEDEFAIIFNRKGNEITFTLINQDGEIFAHMGLIKNKYKGYSGETVAAKTGYGKFIMLIAGGIIYPNPITFSSAGGMNKSAFRVVKKIASMNVVLQPIPKDSPDYPNKNYHYATDDEMKLIRNYFYIKPVGFIKELINNQQKFLKDLNKTPDYFYRLGEDFFEKKYSGLN